MCGPRQNDTVGRHQGENNRNRRLECDASGAAHRPPVTWPARVLATLLLSVALGAPALAELQNDTIGFTPNHVFSGTLEGESIDILNGNLNLRFPIGPRYQLSDWFGYQIQLYYNSKIWTNHCAQVGDQHCPWYLGQSDQYGAGVTLHFGRIYQHPDDRPEIWRYQTPDGSDHYFEDCIGGSGGCDIPRRTADSSFVKFTKENVYAYMADPGPEMLWVAYPGDGTRIIFGYDDEATYDPFASSGATPHGGIYASRVETIARDENNPADPQQYYEITYTAFAKIDKITDSAGREITFSGVGTDVTITMPSFGAATGLNSGALATYTLRIGSDSVDDPKGDPQDTTDDRTIATLDAIEFPAILGTSYAHTFGYGSGNGRYGYLLDWTLPTGALVRYYYRDYFSFSKVNLYCNDQVAGGAWENPPTQCGQINVPNAVHSEIAYKSIQLDTSANPPSEEFLWTYTRYGDSVPRTFDDLAGIPPESGVSGSNPNKVYVIGPSGNLTVHHFFHSIYDEGDCDIHGCITRWYDGMLWKTETYAGPVEDPNRLVREETYVNTYDSAYLQFKSVPNSQMARTPVKMRMEETQSVTYGTGNYPTTVRRVVHGDWTNVDGGGTIDLNQAAKARSTWEYDGVDLYRSTYTNYLPNDDFHGAHDFVELRDGSGGAITRTDKHFELNRLACEVRRLDPASGVQLTDCTTLSEQPGDVIVESEYFGDTGNLKTTTIRGGDDGLSRDIHYTWSNGVLASKKYGTLAWFATDREIDGNTGLVISSTDSGSAQARYNWDGLGRLTSIAGGPATGSVEEPVEISYPTIVQTQVKQCRGGCSSSPSDFTESTYNYDRLGRVIEERRRGADDLEDFRLTEYDIEGRVIRSSEWTDDGATPVWTDFEFLSRFTNPDPQPGEPPNFYDPLGRVSKVVRPDGRTVETDYEGLATITTVYGIEGTSGPINAVTTHVNDSFGRLISVDSEVGGADAEYTYDERDNLTEVKLIDPLPPQGALSEQLRRFQYDALGRLRLATHPENGTTEYDQYDARGNLLHHTDARGYGFQQAYDVAKRPTERHFSPDPTAQSPLYTLLLRNSYDDGGGSADGKLTRQEVWLDDGTFSNERTFAYGAATTTASCLSPEDNQASYSGLYGRLASTTVTVAPWSEQVTTSYCYDTFGSVNLIEYPDHLGSGNTQSFVAPRTHNGFLITMTDEVRDFPHLVDVTYGPHGAPIEFIRGNGLINVVDRDDQGRPTSFQVVSPDANNPYAGRPPLDGLFGCASGGGGGGTQELMMDCLTPPVPDIVEWEPGPYTYDQAGNVKGIGSDAFTYDALNRLSTASVASRHAPGVAFDTTYAYDAFGNMTARSKTPAGGTTSNQTFTVDRATNRLVQQDHDTKILDYAFDGAGNMTTAGTQGYVFDSSNRLVEVWDSTDGELVARYDYDANGYRVRAVSDEMETFYVRDGSGQVLTEYRRVEGDTADPEWNKDYIYALGQAFTMLKNKVPEPPTRPWITNLNLTTNRLTVNWDAPDETDVNRYNVRRTRDPGGPNETTDTYSVAGSVFLVNSFDPTWPPDTVLEYEVQARDSAGNLSAWSPKIVAEPFDTAQPLKPENLAASAQDRSVLVTWDPVNEDDLWGYYVERAHEPGNPAPSNWAFITAMPVTQPSFLDFGLTNGQTYVYRVVAVDTSEIVSDYSNTDSAVPVDTVAPARPQSVKAQAWYGSGEIMVSWAPVLDGDLASYTVTRTHGGGNEQTFSQIDKNATTYLDATATDPAEVYTYTVVAVDTSDNPSLGSDPASASPRDAGLTAPVLISTVFEVDNQGTTPAPSGQCEVDAEDDDAIGVRVTWQPTGATDYRVYRAEGAGIDYALAAEVSASNVCASDCTYFDPTVGAEYSHYIVAYDPTTGRESAGQSTVTPIEDDFDITSPSTAVREVIIKDGREDFDETFAENAKIRKVIVRWSRVVESQLVGYHVYRRCQWECDLGVGRSLRDPSCIHSWQRLTDYPVDATAFTDWTAGELRGCYDYAVRAVGPTGEEGPVTYIAGANFNEDGPSGDWAVNLGSEGIWQCADSTAGYSFDNKLVGDWPDERDRINGMQRGSAPATGAPGAPILDDGMCWGCVPVGGGYVYEGPMCQPGGDCSSCDRIPCSYGNLNNAREFVIALDSVPPASEKRELVAFVDWQQSLESDIAGYYVEMAGSTEGPWARLNQDPLAWWETHIDVRLWIFDYYLPTSDYNGDWVGPECAVFRVIAVDENGNESPPSTMEQIVPVPEDVLPYPFEAACSGATATLAAPANVTAVTGDNDEFGCDVHLSWDRLTGSPAPEKYRIYRSVLREQNHTRFYIPAEMLDSDCGADGNGVSLDGDNDDTRCTYIEEGVDDDCPFTDSFANPTCQTGHLDAYYITVVEGADPGELGRESPRSELVLWQCGANPGYALLAPDENMTFDDVWLARMQAPESSDLTDPGEGPVQARMLQPLAAPMLTLGQGAQSPPYEILDLHVDHLGSTRVVTDNDMNFVSQHDFLPFGEEIAPIFDHNTKMFTGHERDQDTGLDYMLARYYGMSVGKFISPDPVPGSQGVPQSWNRYVYVMNRPMYLVDPNGLRPAKVYGEERDVEPGDVITLVDEQGGARHNSIVGGFEENEEGGVDALVYENVYQEKPVATGPGMAHTDKEPHQPELVNSNSAEAGAGYWNAKNFKVGNVSANRKSETTMALNEPISTTRPFTAGEVKNAVEAVGPVTYDILAMGSSTSVCDCAGFVNQVVDKLRGTQRGGNKQIADWLKE